MKMIRSLLFGALAVVTVWGIGVTICAAETVPIQAKAKDNPQQNADDVEGRFEDTPTGEKDEIHVTNNNVNGEHAGVYSDPVNDGALLTIVQQAGPVKVDVEGREGIGAMYWVTVTRTGGGGQGGQKTILWGDVEDMNRPGALVLKDTNTGAGKSDTTDATTDTPTLYCTGPLPAGTGTVEIRLNAESGTYDWEIQGSSYSGVFDGTYVTTQPGIAPGTYTLVVTSRSDGTFRRVIDFAAIELGEYLPASYPEAEIDVTEVSENTDFYYELEGDEIRSITVSAPVDGDEGASNPYEYGDNYTITIDPDNGNPTVSLEHEGVYMLCIVREHNGQNIESFLTLAYFSEEAGNNIDPAEWPFVLIRRPHWNVNAVLRDGTQHRQNSFNGIFLEIGVSASWFDKFTTAALNPPATISSIEKLVDYYFTNHGNNKMDVTIITHGTPGTVKGLGETLVANNAAALMGPINGKVERIRFYGCKVGKDPLGGAFLQAVKNATAATSVSAYISTTFDGGWPLYPWGAGKWGNKNTK